MTTLTELIAENRIRQWMDSGPENTPAIPAILAKAKAGSGLEPAEVAALLGTSDPQIWNELFQTAQALKQRIYGKRIVIFAPLYLSNHCINHCVYCGYHAGSSMPRRKLTMDEIAAEVTALEAMGHKRLALEVGEDPENCPLDYVLESLETIYRVRHEQGAIRRVNVNIAATTVAEYQQLKQAGIGTYILFQETYHPATYQRVHPAGPKSDFEWHLTAFDRAMRAGIDDVGAGVLFGLYDWRYELIALLVHAAYLEQTYGAGPHTVSVPRLRPAHGVNLERYPYLVSDADFAKIITLLRLALPYTGIILSTRESPALREHLLKLGVSQISAGSCTGVGGYAKQAIRLPNTAQFEVDDQRSPDEIFTQLCNDGFLPSFCTACYRQGRTGDRFMSLAKSGEIGNICTPNAILTFQEYLIDYASPETSRLGERHLASQLEQIPDPHLRKDLQTKLTRLRNGERDLYY